MSLGDFFKSLVPNFERTRVLEELELAKKNLVDETLPPYKTVVEAKVFVGPNPFKSSPIKKINNVYMREAGSRYNMVTSLAMILSSVANALPELEKYVESSFKTSSVEKLGLTYNKISLLRVISILNFFSLYSRRVLLYTYGQEVPEWLRDHANTPQPFTRDEVKWIETHLVNFARVAKIFSQPMRQILNTLESIPDIVYDPERENDVESVVGKNKVDPLRLGFVPVVSDIIWFFGSAYVEHQAESFKKAKEERRVLEMRMIQLQEAMKGQADAAQDKTIQVTEQRLRDLNYKILKMERNYGV